VATGGLERRVARPPAAAIKSSTKTDPAASTLARGCSSSAAAGRGFGFSNEQGTTPSRGKVDREPFTDGHRALPTLGIEVSAAQRAARRKWRDSLAALGAIAGLHTSEDAARPCPAAKRNVS
jgi:hypothetical protein